MNLIGHNYIAFKILGHVNPNTLIGSHIPDFAPFLPSSVFSFTEIHEEHEDFLRFVKENYPNETDLPLSMMCHSVKYGADEYNREIDQWLLEDNKALEKKLANMICDVSGIPYELAVKSRMHNYLWCGADIYLMKNNPQDVITKLVAAFENIDFGSPANILAEFYKKDPKDVERNLRDHFKPIKAETFQDVEAFNLFWGNFLWGLPEGDKLDKTKSRELLEFIYKTFEGEWDGVIGRVEKNVKEKMEVFIS